MAVLLLAQPALLMPTTREHSACLEASRAAALAAHSAAGLAAAAGLREAARLLRSCEALARAATAALQSSSTSASSAPLGATSAAGQAQVVSNSVPAAPAAPAAGRRKKNKKKKAGVNSQPMVIDGILAAGGVPAVAPAPAAVANQLSPIAPVFTPGAAAAAVRVLEKKPSRERSPRFGASLKPPSSSLSSPSTATSSALPADEAGLLVGGTAVLVGLVSRPELVGSLVSLSSFDGASGRWAVSLDATGESIRVKADNLQPSFYVPSALVAGAAV